MSHSPSIFLPEKKPEVIQNKQTINVLRVKLTFFYAFSKHFKNVSCLSQLTNQCFPQHSH